MVMGGLTLLVAGQHQMVLMLLQMSPLNGPTKMATATEITPLVSIQIHARVISVPLVS